MASPELKRTIPKKDRAAHADALQQRASSEAEKNEALHRRLIGWFFHEATRQASNRRQMAKCEAYYDNEQIARKRADDLRDRGQDPVVYNEIAPAIDWMIGTEIRNRTDFVVVPEEEGEEAADEAQAKTKTMKWLDATNKASFERSDAVQSQLKAGLGWVEVGVRGDRSGPIVFIGGDSWRNHLHDSQATKRGFTDGRYHFRIKVVDLDVAIACFPDKETELRRVMQEGDQLNSFGAWLGSGLISGLDHFDGSWEPDEFNTARPVDVFNPRERVMLVECWHREPIKRKLDDEGLGDPVTWEIRVTIMTEHDVLHTDVSPFRHELFPFIPYVAYVKRSTGMPYSPIVRMIGPQDALNMRMGRSVWEAAKNQVKMERTAIDAEVMDIEEIRAELDDPNGIAVFADGALSAGRVQERDDLGKAQRQLQLAEHDLMHLRQTSGVTSENRGLDSNATSGKAVLAKADQGSILTAQLVDNQYFARQMEGEMVLSLMEQFMVTPRTITIPGDAKHEFLKINEQQADGSYRNDITKRRSRFVVSEQAWKQNYAEAAFEQLMQVFTQLAAAAPNVVIAMLDVLFEIHPNLPKKALILQRIRQVTGQSSPDGKLTPEQQQAQQMAAAKAKAEFEAHMAQLKATVLEAQAKGEKLEAEGMAKRLETIYMAAQAAQVAVQIPGAMPVADQLLKSAGFEDRDGGAVAQQPAQAQPGPSVPEPLQADGAMRGIETMAPDGVAQGAM
jgi:hypothetical protein